MDKNSNIFVFFFFLLLQIHGLDANTAAKYSQSVFGYSNNIHHKGFPCTEAQKN